MIAFNIGRAVAGLGIITGFCFSAAAVHAGVAISGGGQATYSQAIAVPPGIAGMEPKLAFSYVEGGINGPEGVGWSVQGISSITRCPANRATDGAVRGVVFGPSDKLCLDGQRLIQTDAAGTPLSLALQTNGAQGLAAGAQREYRTEKDTFARIRAYGIANGTDANNGPAYLKVWTKSGQIYEYGTNPNANANALVNAQGKAVVAVWAVSRIGDSLGNSIDFKYEQRDPLWGSGPTPGSPLPGHEWNIVEIQYSGNKVIFNYDPLDQRIDKSEAYHQGAKNVSVRRLQSITTYVNAPNTGSLGAGSAVPVKTTKIGYDNGLVSKRSRVTTIRECAGDASSTRCLPANSFNYAPGGSDAYQANTNFTNSPLATLTMQSLAGNYGVLTGDFDGDGKTDFIRWSDTPSETQLYLSNGDGGFRQVTPGTAAGQFNITNQNLFKSDGCYYAIAADFNGDGVTDILRIMRATSSSGASCGTQNNILYLGNADGSFRPVSVTGIDFSQRQSSRTEYYNCLAPFSAGYVVGCKEPGDILLGTGQSPGTNFHLIDVNGDGVLDIVTSMIPSFGRTLNPPTEATQCASIVCTHVYLGSANGIFVEQIATNLTHRSIYADPPGRYNYFRMSYVADVSGDGLADLLVDSGVWISRGDGNFDVGPANSSPVGCAHAIDFNGDGRLDCLGVGWNVSSQYLTVSDGTYAPKNVAGFNLKSAGQELIGWSSTFTQSIGTFVADINGDGRQDILRWKDDATQNVVYVSNGDGTFTQSGSFNLNTSTTQLRKSDGSADFIIGDFTGHGTTEFLRLKASPRAGEATSNQLYVKTDPTPPDHLISVTTGSGATTTLYYVPLSNATPGNGVSASYGARYTSDRGTPKAAGGNTIDISFPMYVVATSNSDSGVGSKTVKTEYSYFGLKADITGRGLLGFREVHRQSPAPNGAPLTVVTQYVQTYPYTGVAGLTRTYMGDLGLSGAQLLSQTTNSYCDKTSATAPSAIATPGTAPSPCATVALLQRPYLYQTVEQGWDLTNPQLELPRTTTTNTFNNSGDPLVIVSTTAGTALGLSQTFTKTTTNTYLPDVTSADSWILGRLQRASVQSSVPNSLPNIATSTGFSPSATARQGTGQTQFATLSAISFGSITATSNAVQTSTLTNTGALPLTITVPASGSVAGVGFAFASTTCGASLPAYSSCTVGTTFTPSAASAYTGTLSVVTGAGTLTAILSGTGIAPSVVYVPVSTNWGVVGVASDSGDWPQIKNNTASSVLLTAHSTVSGPSGMWSWQGTTGYCIPGTTVLAPGASCQTFFGIGTAAIPRTYSATDQISFQVVGGNGVTFTVQQGYAFSLATTTPNPSSLAFGNVTVNTTSAVKIFTLTNNAVNGSSVKSLAISVVGGQPANFPMSHNCGTTIGAGASCTVTVSFNPTSVSGFSASVQITGGYSRMQGGVDSGYTPSTTGVNLTMPLSGTGVADAPNISISPNTVSFGNQLDGATASATLTVTNTGGPGTFSIAGVGEFSYSNGACPANGALLPANSTCTVTASFTGFAQCGGLVTTVRGTLTVSAGSSSANAALSGTHHVYKWTDPQCR